MLQYNLEDVNNTFVATFGDRVGWTFLTGNRDFVFSYDGTKQTFFYDFETEEPPAVGAIVTGKDVSLPVVHSIAVRVDTSKYIMTMLGVPHERNTFIISTRSLHLSVGLWSVACHF